MPWVLLAMRHVLDDLSEPDPVGWTTMPPWLLASPLLVITLSYTRSFAVPLTQRNVDQIPFRPERWRLK